MSITIETAAQLISFLQDGVLTASSATNISSYVDGSATWASVTADVYLTSDGTYDLSGTIFTTGSSWGSAGGTASWKNGSGTTGVAGSGLFTFDGQGSVIKNFHLNGSATNKNGFFRGQFHANVKKISFEDCFVYGTNDIAVIAGNAVGDDTAELAQRPYFSQIRIINSRVRGTANIGSVVGLGTNVALIERCQVIKTKAAGTWPFTVPEHTSGCHIDIELETAPTYGATEILEEETYYDGSTVTVIDPANQPTITGSNMSFTCSIKNTANESGYLIWRGDASGNNSQWGIYRRTGNYSGGDNFAWDEYDGSGRGTLRSTAAVGWDQANNTTKWWSVAVTVNNTEVKFYLDGVYKHSVQLASDFSDVSSGPLWLGGSQELGSLRIVGWLKNVRLYNNVLTATEIEDIHDSAGSSTASDTVSNAGSIAGQLKFEKHGFIMEHCQSNASLTANKTTGGLVGNWVAGEIASYSELLGEEHTFDGTIANSITVDSSIIPTITSPFTVSMWIQGTTSNTDSGYLIWRGTPGTSSYTTKWGCYIDMNNNYMYSEMGDGSGAGQFLVAGGAGIRDTGVWHHLVWVWNGNNVAKYSEGSYLDDHNHTNSFSDDTSMPLILGGGRGETGLSHYWIGKMKKVRIYPSALTASEISGIYDAGHDDTSAPGIGTKTGTLRDCCYTGQTLLSFIGRTGGLIGSSDKGIDTIQRCYTVPKTINSASGTELSTVSQSHPSSGTESSAGWLLGYLSSDWTLSSSTIEHVYYSTYFYNSTNTNVFDIDGNVVTTAEANYTEVLSTETYYDGNTVTVVNSPPSVTGSTMSVTFDLKNTANESGYILWRGDSSGNHSQWGIYRRTGSTSDNFAWDEYDGSGRGTLRSTGAVGWDYANNLTKWWSVAVTVNGTTVKFYLDGVYKDSITLSTTFSDVSSGPMWLGGSQELGSLRIVGWLRNVRVYNDVLTDAEILDIHNTGGTAAASDKPIGQLLSEENSLWKYLSSAETSGFEEYTEILTAETQYDGTTVTTIASEDQPTITGSTMSVTFDIKNTSNESGYILWRGDSSGNNSQWGIYRRTGNYAGGDNFAWDEYDGSGRGTLINTSAVGWDQANNTTKWWNAAVTVSGTTVKFYLDGVYKDSITLSTTFSDVASGPMWLVGSQELGSLRLEGWLRLVRVWDKELSASEVSDIASGNIGSNKSGQVKLLAANENIDPLYLDNIGNSTYIIAPQTGTIAATAYGNYTGSYAVSGSGGGGGGGGGTWTDGTILDPASIDPTGLQPNFTDTHVSSANANAAITAATAQATTNAGAGATAIQIAQEKSSLLKTALSAYITKANSYYLGKSTATIDSIFSDVIIEGSTQAGDNDQITNNALVVAIAGIGITVGTKSPIDVKKEYITSSSVYSKSGTIAKSTGTMILNDTNGISYWKVGSYPVGSTGPCLSIFNLKRVSGNNIVAAMTADVSASFPITDYLSKISASSIQDALDDGYYWLVVQTTEIGTISTIEDLPFQFQIDFSYHSFTSLTTQTFHSNISGVYTLQLISGDVTIANVNKSGSSSGDPIISPIFGYPYQLPCTNNSYLFFDNMSSEEDRLVVNVQMKVLSKKEKCRLTECVEKQWNIKLNDNDVLSYAKYVAVYWNKQWKMYDIDNFCSINTSVTYANILLGRTVPIEKLKTKDNTKEIIMKSSLNFYNKPSKKFVELEYNTKKHGKIILKLCSFMDAEMRNGISISGNVTKENSYGCLISCPNLKTVTLNSFTEINPLIALQTCGWETPFLLRHAITTYEGKQHRFELFTLA